MSKRMRTILLSMVIVCLSLSLVIGGTYALFSDKVTVNNHLEAGNLKVGLERVSYETYALGTNGTLVTNTDTQTVDLTADATALFRVEKAVPGSWYQAEIKVSNNGDVAFDYGMRILWNQNNTATTLQQKFASQIQITVTAGGTQKAQRLLSEMQDVDLGSILAGAAAQTFTLKAEFLNSEDNNDVQEISLDFDLQVYAVQKVN